MRRPEDRTAEGAAPAPGAPWTVGRFFTLLTGLGPLRIVSECGPSTFEAICRVESFDLADGFVTTLGEGYHWYLLLDGFGHVLSRDEVSGFSRRRVLFFELRRDEEAEPFLLVYLFRQEGEDFEEEPERAFAEAHRELATGRALDVQ